jgi:hypothetical protein
VINPEENSLQASSFFGLTPFVLPGFLMSFTGGVLIVFMVKLKITCSSDNEKS